MTSQSQRLFFKIEQVALEVNTYTMAGRPQRPITVSGSLTVAGASDLSVAGPGAWAGADLPPTLDAGAGLPPALDAGAGLPLTLNAGAGIPLMSAAFLHWRTSAPVYTFNSTGREVSPNRKALVDAAAALLAEIGHVVPMKYYVFVFTGGNYIAGSEDLQNHILCGRCNEEVLVAALDCLNEYMPTRTACDHYESDISDIDRVFYSDGRPNADLYVSWWLKEVRFDAKEHHVPELSRLVKAARVE